MDLAEFKELKAQLKDLLDKASLDLVFVMGFTSVICE